MGIGSSKCTLRGHSGGVWSVAFSPDNKTLASGSSDNTVKLWDVSGDTPKEKGTLTGHSASWPDLTPEEKALVVQVHDSGAAMRTRNARSKYIVTAQHKDIYVFHVDQPEPPVACFRSPSRVNSVAYQPPTVCAGCESGQV